MKKKKDLKKNQEKKKKQLSQLNLQFHLKK